LEGQHPSRFRRVARPLRVRVHIPVLQHVSDRLTLDQTQQRYVDQRLRDIRDEMASINRDALFECLSTTGATLARAVSRRATPRHHGHGLGLAVPTLPRGQGAGQAPARAAARRALLIVQHRLRTRFHPQCRADLPSRAVAAAAAGGRAVLARAGHDPARQISGRSRRAYAQEFRHGIAAGPLPLPHGGSRRQRRCRRRRGDDPGGHRERPRHRASAARPQGRNRRQKRYRPAAVLRRRGSQLGA
jgi:hypothetical protein